MTALQEPFARLRSLKRNEGLLPLYAGVIAEARRSLDDWIPVHSLPAFEALAHEFGLTVVSDCIFDPLAPDRQVNGLRQAPTTRAIGRPMREVENSSLRASVHVFVSKRREWAEEALYCYSYPIGIPRERLLIRPRVDAVWLGAAFGYPACCVRSFIRWNDWASHSHPSQAYRSEQLADRRTNCLVRHTLHMTIHHVPCGPRCSETISQSQAILEAVAEFDPEYRRAIEQAMGGVFLILNEAAIFKLHGAVFEEPDRVAYRRAERVSAARAHYPSHVTHLARRLEQARWVEVADGMVTTGNGSELSYEVDPRSEWIEDPLLVTFV